MDEELLQAFLVECRELVQQASDDLLALEAAPADAARLDGAFRAFHTLKGSAAMFDLGPMRSVLHAGEDLLEAIRRGQAAVEPARLAALVEAVSQTERWLDAIEAAGALPDDAEGRARSLEARLGEAGPAASPPPSPALTRGAEWASAMAARFDQPGPLVAVRYRPDAEAYFRGEDPLGLIERLPGLVAMAVAPREPFGPLADYDPFRCNLLLEALSTASEDEVRTALRLAGDQAEIAQTPGAQAGAASAQRPAPSRSLRVDVERIDALAAAADELVIAKNAVARLAAQALQGQAAAEALARPLADAQAHLDRLVGRMHAAVMRVRLAPLAPLFGRFPRAVRDLAAQLGKSVDLVLEGEQVEVDKALVDGLYEPLLHVLRNAVDHGVEPPEARRAAGKQARATIRLTARAAPGDQVEIEVADDGRGLDLARIRTAALVRGIASEETLSALSDAETAELVFTPGFSTAQALSDVSGRGVGMDAVRAATARLGGRVGIESRPGQGATVRLLLPLSVVLAKVMVVVAGGERFGLLLDHVVETVRVRRDQISAVRAGEAFVLRETVLPLAHLSSLLGLAPAQARDEALRVVVVQAGAERIGVAVDAFADRVEAPLRPLAGVLAGLRGVAGAVLLADGEVLMVLDLAELIG